MPRTNLRRVRPKEVALIRDLMLEPSEDAEGLAETILRALNKYRAEEPAWVRVVQDGSAAVIYGPYQTGEAARADDLSAGTKPGGRMFVASLVPPYGQPLLLDAEEREINT